MPESADSNSLTEHEPAGRSWTATPSSTHSELGALPPEPVEEVVSPGEPVGSIALRTLTGFGMGWCAFRLHSDEDGAGHDENGTEQDTTRDALDVTQQRR